MAERRRASAARRCWTTSTAASKRSALPPAPPYEYVACVHFSSIAACVCQAFQRMDETESVHQAAAEAKKAQERKLKGLEEKQVERCPVRNLPTLPPATVETLSCVRCLCAAL